MSGVPAVYLSVAQSLSWLLGGIYSGFLWEHKGKISHSQLQALRESGSGVRTLRGSVLFCKFLEMFLGNDGGELTQQIFMHITHEADTILAPSGLLEPELEDSYRDVHLCPVLRKAP